MSDPGSTSIPDGRDDLRRAADELAERIPDRLAPLARLAYNYRWSWLPGAPELFASVDRVRFELCLQNPVRLLQEASSGALRRAAEDHRLVAQARAFDEQVRAELGRPAADGTDPSRPVGFFCAEYGVHVSLPVYSGGLGALAGDLLKEASDQALPMVAVGLLYRKGYFRQRIDAGGWQHEYWIDTDPQRLPAVRVSAADGDPLTIEVPIYDTNVLANVWRVDVGRVPLFLLDTDISGNGPLERWITGRLYEADPAIRLAQYVLLGVGGMNALRAVGIEPGVIHLNEGHAALAPLAFAAGDFDEGTAPAGAPRSLDEARARTVFTTHTPVPAGNDSYPAEQLGAAIRGLVGRLGLSEAELVALGQTHPGDSGEAFGVTQAALRLSGSAGGVSRRHGEVSRGMWASLWSERPVEEVPIAHVTNGVHVPTWIGPAMLGLLNRHLGADWTARVADPRTWEAVDQIPARELWEVRGRQRSEMTEFIRARSTQDRLLRGDVREYVEAADRGFDENVLTIGFARRVATYKRLELLTRDPELTLGLLGGERPVQVVLAGKAHPRDEEAKHALRHLFGMKAAQVVAQRVVYLDDYDLAVAAMLVRGCDVWLNLPRPPLEASGTSGMKSAFNGGLQVSVLDGWWAEAYDGSNGWALPGETSDDVGAQDHRDAEILHGLLRGEVVPSFYERDGEGIPLAWIERMRASLRTLGPRFCAARMLSEYANGPYQQAADQVIPSHLT